MAIWERGGKRLHRAWPWHNAVSAMVGIGQRIGNFRVLRKLGQGGMGAVFEAVQEEIGRRAAIKVLLQQFGTDQQSISRFINEARAVNIIAHPGLVGIFESGRLEDGSAYIIMEYLDGELLGNRLRRIGALAQSTALNLGRQIASALAAAHQKAIVHRDLKPDNIMIVSDPETPGGERIKVFDFGLAKLWSSSPTPDFADPAVFRTNSGAVLGTPTHMSPEQCRGRSEITGKADVYSLGVILFEMLAGHPPFMATSVGDLISMHLRDLPPSLRKLEKSVSAPLADLVAAMLSKEPAERPEMAQVVQELESLGANRTAPSRHVSVSPEEAAELAVAKTQAGPSSSAMPASGKPKVVAKQGRPHGERRRLLALAALALLIAGSASAWLLTRTPSPAQVGTATTVTWMIDSQPSGAEIVRVDTGEILGQTPWLHTEAPREAFLRLQLRLAAHRDSAVIINQSQNNNQTVLLEPAPKLDGPAPITAGALDQQQKRMRWTVSSEPSGAEVVLADDNQVLGKTPWTLEQSADNSVLKLFLQLPGYVRTSVLLDMSAGTQQTIILQRSGEKPRSGKPAPGARPPAFSPVY